jgi:glutaredoxin
MMSLLSRWVRPRPTPDVGHLTLTVYTRQGCGCCQKALDLLKDHQRRHGFAIELVDVDSDPELVSRFGETVPVVAVNGKVRFKGVVNPVLLERLLLAESRGR